MMGELLSAPTSGLAPPGPDVGAGRSAAVTGLDRDGLPEPEWATDRDAATDTGTVTVTDTGTVTVTDTGTVTATDTGTVTVTEPGAEPDCP
jgi:hypothetical protein